MTGVAKQGRRGSGKRRSQSVSTRTRDAVALLIADKDMDIAKAAVSAGMTPASLARALREGPGRAHYLKAIRSITDGSALKAARQLDALIDGATSEYVRADSAKFTLDRVLPRPAERVPLGDGKGVRITFISVGAQQAGAPGTVVVDGVALPAEAAAIQQHIPSEE